MKSCASLGARQPIRLVRTPRRLAPARRSPGRSSRPAPCRRAPAARALHAPRTARRGDRARAASSSGDPAGGHAAQDGVALPVAARRHVIGALERGRGVAQQRVHLGLGPDVEAAFLALAVGVLGGGERGTAGHALRGHVARHPADGLRRARGIQRVGPMRVRQRQQFQQLRVVVQHLLEMRHQPDRVGRIAGIAAAEMVVDAALRHPLQHQVQRVLALRRAGAEGVLPQEAEDRRVGEFRRALQAALLRIVHAAAAPPRPHPDAPASADRPGWPATLPRQHAAQRGGVLRHHLVVGAPGLGDALQHLAERRPPPARLRREIRAAPERRAVRGDEHGQRPAALLAQRVQRRHVQMVDVRPLLAVHLDVDEALVHQRRGLGVLEGFVRHHVAPVAGGIADRQQDRLVRRRAPPPAPPAPRAASAPDCRRAAADRARSRGGAGLRARPWRCAPWVSG